MIDEETLKEFLEEAKEHLEEIEGNIIELEKDPSNSAVLDAIFRTMHSLKGASGFLNLQKINTLTHKAESVMDALRNNELENSPEIMDVILNTTDILNQIIANLEETGEEGDVDIDEVMAQLEDILKQKGMPSKSEEEKEQNKEEVKEDKTAGEKYKLTVEVPDHLIDFVEEAREIVRALNNALLSLESNPDKSEEVVQEIFRYFHNLKGNSGLIGYKELNDLTHKAETLLNHYRTNKVPLDPETIDFLLSLADMIEKLIDVINLDDVSVSPPDISEFSSRLDSLIEKVTGTKIENKEIKEGANVEGSAVEEISESEEVEVEDEDLKIFKDTVRQQFEKIFLSLKKLETESTNAEYMDTIYRAISTLKNACEYMEFEEQKVYAQRVLTLVDQARKKGGDFSLFVPILSQEAEILQDLINKEVEKVEAKLKKEKEEEPKTPEEKIIEEIEKGPEVTDLKTEKAYKEIVGEAEVAEVSKEEKKKEKREVVAEAKENKKEPIKEVKKTSTAAVQKAKVSSTIRVDHEKLDHLMNLIGELIINRNRFVQLTRELAEGKKDINEIIMNLSETTDVMTRISNDLQDTIMQVRMVPVKTVFSRFPRLVRDLSRKSGKKVELITEGEETELDKTVVEAINDPLVHIIRNCVDHGIEPPEERKAKGKPEVGHIWLRAEHEGNFVVISVEDDGRGIDPEKIKKKALEKGLVSAEDLEKMDEREILDLIFLPGFSTAEKVTDVSGRGVGMDVVKNNIKKLNGNISLHSEVGKGTKIVLYLPLTLAIIEALLVEVGGEIYAIPLDNVSETTKISKSQINEINKRKATILRGEVIALINLAEVLGFSKNGQKDILPIVIINVNDRKIGLIVDSLLHRQEIVIKSLGEYLGNIPGIGGATIMGDGSVVMILDLSEIYSLATGAKT